MLSARRASMASSSSLVSSAASSRSGPACCPDGWHGELHRTSFWAYIGCPTAVLKKLLP